MIEIKEGNYYVGIWFIGGQEKDWMLCLYREGDEWKIQYRWRYYKDQKAFGSKDEKSWYGFNVSVSSRTEKEMMGKIDVIAKKLAEDMKSPLEIVMIQSGDIEFVTKVLTAQPWAHTQQVGDLRQGGK